MKEGAHTLALQPKGPSLGGQHSLLPLSSVCVQAAHTHLLGSRGAAGGPAEAFLWLLRGLGYGSPFHGQERGRMKNPINQKQCYVTELLRNINLHVF